jgi:uncharacterized membrane protein
MTPNYILRQNAKQQLGGRIFSEKWVLLAVACLVCTAVIGAAGGVTFGIGAILISGPLTYGLSRTFVNNTKGKVDVDFNDLICGFRECFGGSIVLSVLTSIYTFLWSLLFVIPGIVKSYSYAMAPYIQQDDPAKDASQCIDESRAMMKGYKGQLFLLDLSFIGWYFVGALCFGIGTLFVYPYHHAARANFYLALKAKDEPAIDVEV